MNATVMRTKLADGMNLHIMRTSKFKTILIRFILRIPLAEETASAAALINQMTTRLSKRWPELRQVNRRLDELYGAGLYGHVSKLGETHILEWNLHCPAPKRVGEPGLLKEALQFMRDMICDPYIQGEGFEPVFFQHEKNLMDQEIKARLNDKMSYAYERCIEELCAGEPYSIHRLGDANALKSLDPVSTYDQYLDLLGKEAIDWVVVGDVEPKYMVELLGDVFRLPPRGPVPWGRESTLKKGKLRQCTEPMNVTQGKLCLGYRTAVPYESPDYDSALLFSMLLGGGASSRLFQTVREKESLCYTIYSRMEKFKSLMIVGAGIDIDKADQVQEAVVREVAALKAGAFTVEELSLACKTVIRSLSSIQDSQNGMADYYISQHLSTKRYDIAETIEALQRVTVEDIAGVSQSFELEQIYFLTAKEGTV